LFSSRISYLHGKLNQKSDNESYFSIKSWLVVLDSDRNNFCVVIRFFWEHYLLCTILCATVVIFEIEMLIHTQYVITEDGWLKVETGRFIPNASLEIDQILRIRKVRSMAFWQPALSFERLEVRFLKTWKGSLHFSLS